MRIIFWLSLIGILYTYVGYPIAMSLLARFWPRPWKAVPGTPGVSIVMAVHNGATMLPKKIDHLLGLDYPNVERIIIVSDGSTDGTAELLAGFNHPRVKAVILEEHRGKAVAVNAGVAAATAEIIVFVDIRPEIAPGAIQELVSNFADAKVGCVSGNLTLRQDGHDGASAAVGGFYWRYEQWLRTCEAAWDSPVGVYGGFYAIRRELAVMQPDGMILDDMYQPLSIVAQGYRSVLDLKAHVCDMWPKDAADEFHRKVRTLAGNFQLFRVAPWTLTPHNRLLFQLVSHKLMRLVVPYLLVALLASTVGLSMHSRAYAAFAALQILGWAIATLGIKFRLPILHRIASPASALLVLNAAAVVGFYKFLFTRGPLWKIWVSAKPAADEHHETYATGPVTTSVNAWVSNSVNERRHETVMSKQRMLLIAVLGIAGLVTGVVYRNHIVKVKAARLEHPAASATYFPAGAPWTQDVSHAALDPRSPNITNWLASVGGWGHGRMQVDFGLRVLQATATTPSVPFHKADGWISPDGDAVSAIPLPASGGMEAHEGYDCPTDQEDCHLIVVDREHQKLYEAWGANYAKNYLRATIVALWDLSRVYPPSGRGDQCASADAAGFPIAPLLFNADELASGSINHAIRFVLPNPRIRAQVYVHPATHGGAPSGPPNAPPYGARLRLKASYDVSRLSPAAQVVARAMQKYGMFLADDGNITLTAQNDQDTATKYADLGFTSHDLQDLKVTDFEVVDEGQPIKLTDECVRNK